MKSPRVIVLMGSKADEGHSRKIAEALRRYGIECELRVGSAHKTPSDVLAMLADYEADGHPKVYITVAGRSNALSGFVDGAVTAPVIACPPPSDSYGGADLWSSIRMPSGVACAYVAEPVNAALFAAKILAATDPAIHTKILDEKEERTAVLRAADAELRGGAAAR